MLQPAAIRQVSSAVDRAGDYGRPDSKQCVSNRLKSTSGFDSTLYNRHFDVLAEAARIVRAFNHSGLLPAGQVSASCVLALVC